MINLASIYRNRCIAAGYYFVKVIDIDTEEVGLNRPRIQVALKIGPMYEEGGTILNSIIHATDASRYWYKNFILTFWVSGARLHEAIGKWGSVEVYDAHHGETKYSSVKYVYQPLPIRMRTYQIAQDEQQGLLNWEDQSARSTPTSTMCH